MTVGIVIRKMEIEDIPAVFKLGVTAYIKEKGSEKAYAYSYWTLTGLSKIIEEYPELSLVATFRKKVIGFAIGHPSYEHLTDVGYFEWIAVDKSYRGKGYAQELAKALIDIYRAKEYKKLVADIQGDNTPSLNLFKNKLRFKEKESIIFLESEI